MPSSLPSIIFKSTFAIVLLACLAFAVGLAWSNFVPGCHCDTGAGCGGCGLDALVASLVFGGFICSLLSVFVVLPVGIIAGLVAAYLVNRRERQTDV